MVPNHVPTVEPFDNPDLIGCGQVVPDPDHSPRAGLCTDGTYCLRNATKLVTVAGTSVACCGHHVEEAGQFAADHAGVELSDDRPRPDVSLSSDAPSDPFDRSPDDYDVSDHPSYEG